MGTKLQELRHKKRYSQSQLAAAAGVSMRSIQCYEQQSRRIDSVKLDTLCDLALSLDCKIEDMLEAQTLINKFRLVK